MTTFYNIIPYIIFAVVSIALFILLEFYNKWFVGKRLKLTVITALTLLIIILPMLIFYFFSSSSRNLLLMLEFLFTGGVFSYVYKKLFPWQSRNTFATYSVSFLIVILSALAVFLIFNSLPNYKYSINIWIPLLAFSFVFIQLFYDTYLSLISIPKGIFNLWYYDKETTPIYTEYKYSPTAIVNIVLKRDRKSEEIHLKAKAPVMMPFGAWFQLLINDYNRKSYTNKIVYTDAHENLYGWVFYIERSIFLFRIDKYIDAFISIRENKLTEYDLIIAKRVSKK